MCAALASAINTARQAAIQCDSSGPARTECNTMIQDECGCDVSVASPDSQASTDFRNAVTEFKDAHCSAACTQLVCMQFVSGRCQMSGANRVCVGISATTGG